jgi:hypothetical protein
VVPLDAGEALALALLLLLAGLVTPGGADRRHGEALALLLLLAGLVTPGGAARRHGEALAPVLLLAELVAPGGAARRHGETLALALAVADHPDAAGVHRGGGHPGFRAAAAWMPLAPSFGGRPRFFSTSRPDFGRVRRYIAEARRKNEKSPGMHWLRACTATPRRA